MTFFWTILLASTSVRVAAMLVIVAMHYWFELRATVKKLWRGVWKNIWFRIGMIVGVIVTVIILISPDGDSKEDSSPTAMIIGLIFILAMLSFFVYIIRKKIQANNPSKSKGIGITLPKISFSFKKALPWLVSIASIAILLFIFWPWLSSYYRKNISHEDQVATTVYVTNPQPVQTRVQPNQPNGDDENADPPEISDYGTHYFGKGLWYKYSTFKHPKHWFVSHSDGTILRQKAIGNDGDWYKIRAINQSDLVDVNNHPVQ